jgi:indolepyruvate ferredoxin oxidoreductase
VINSAEMSTADFVLHRDASIRASDRRRAIERVVGKDNVSLMNANQLAETLLGNTIYANVMMLGFAWQKGLLPVSGDALLRAIELNGVETEKNKQAFGWGRLVAADKEFVAAVVDGKADDSSAPESLEDIIERRRAFLVDYQDRKLAQRFVDLVERTRKAELAIDPGSPLPLTEAVARSYFKTLAYKDEYEVARLHTRSGFLEKIRDSYGDAARIRFHLAPPILSGRRDARGRPRKREFGAWIIPVFRVLAAMRRLRGSRLDLFGMTAERRMERTLVAEFEQVIEQLIGNLSADNVAAAVSIAELFLDIRGYGPVKEQAVDEVREKIRGSLADYVNVTSQAA